MAKNVEVTVYSTPMCPYCTMAKNFLKENKIAFKEVDVSRNESAAREMIEKSGQMGVPVIDIGGKIVIGFDKPAIARALGLEL